MTTPFRHGGIRFPLASPPAVDHTLLRDADPVSFYLLEYYAWCIREYVGARLLYEAAAIDLPWADAVETMVPYDPRPYMRESQTGFPMLGLYRVRSAHDDLTTTVRREVSQLELAYVLPPLGPSQFERIGPILNAVKALLDHKSEAGWDPDYTPTGGVAGATLFATTLAGLTDLAATQASFGGYPTTNGDLVFPAVMVTIQTTESATMDDGDLPPFEGADIRVDSTEADGSSFPTTSTGVVEQNPTAASVFPNQGTKAGGEPVTISGTHFVPGVTVRFGGSVATLKDFSATALLVQAPPAPGIAGHFPSYAVDVEIHLPSGQSTLMPAAYTYVD